MSSSNDWQWTADGRLFYLRRAVQRLAAPAPTQLGWLRHYSYPALELLEEFEDLMDMSLEPLVENGLVTTTTASDLASLLTFMTSGMAASDYGDAALNDSDRWAAIRRRAAALLADLPVVDPPPGVDVD